MYLRLSSVAALLAACLLAAAAPAAEKSKDDRTIKDGMAVTFHYTLSETDGKLIESTKGKEPLKYVHGKKMMIAGLEKELTGMKVGGEKHITVKPEDAYGPVDPQRYQEFPKDKIPPDQLKNIKVGSMVPLTAPNGQTFQFPVSEVKEKSIVVNLNHPMAGKTLTFDVKVVDIQPEPPATSQPATPAAPAKPAAPAQPQNPANPAQKK
jgi:FKBP-type peptidyl-prolyl cis-trans isomerase 2